MRSLGDGFLPFHARMALTLISGENEVEKSIDDTHLCGCVGVEGDSCVALVM